MQPWEIDTATYQREHHPDAVALPGRLSPQRLAVRWYLLELAIQRAIPGGIVAEFGVADGTSIRWLAERLPDETVHGFDSFRGLPEPWEDQWTGGRPGGIIPAGTFDRGGQPPAVPRNVTLHVGLFEETLPGFLAAHAGPVRLAHIDCDIYSATHAVLRSLAAAGRVAPGTVFVFDELWNYSAWREHEWKALVEVAEEFGWIWTVTEYLQHCYQANVQILSVGGR